MRGEQRKLCRGRVPDLQGKDSVRVFGRQNAEFTEIDCNTSILLLLRISVQHRLAMGWVSVLELGGTVTSMAPKIFLKYPD